MKTGAVIEAKGTHKMASTASGTRPDNSLAHDGPASDSLVYDNAHLWSKMGGERREEK